MEYQFRIMSHEDIAQALVLFKELKEEEAGVSFTDIVSHEQMTKWLADEHSVFFSAFVEDKLVAVFRAKRGSGNQQHAALLTIAIQKEVRGKHLAKSFTLYCLEQLKAMGMSLARAYVYSDNLPSVSTLLACGFTLSGCVYQHHYSSKLQAYVDDLIFHKLL